MDSVSIASRVTFADSSISLSLNPKLRALLRPSKRMHRNFMDYIYTENPVAESDQDLILHEHDFVSLEHFEESWLDQLVHRYMEHALKGIFRVYSQYPHIKKPPDIIRNFS